MSDEFNPVKFLDSIIIQAGELKEKIEVFPAFAEVLDEKTIKRIDNEIDNMLMAVTDEISDLPGEFDNTKIIAQEENS